jgi:hypothetical protein
MSDEKEGTTSEVAEDATRLENGIELDESDLDTVAGGATWHPETIDVVTKSWEETPNH